MSNSTATLYTDTQLKQALAKMLPEKLGYTKIHGLVYFPTGNMSGRSVLDTELLHLCWLVEETLTLNEKFSVDDILLNAARKYYYPCWHTAWQQRTIALAKLKGIEIT